MNRLSRAFVMKIVLLAIGLLIFGIPVSEAATWRTYDGQTFQGDVSAFNFETKMVTLVDTQSGNRMTYHANDLDFFSKRRLLISKAFHSSFPNNGPFWPKEKMTLVGIAILSPIVLLIAGMWLAGLFIAKKFNPFSAVGAFLGSWIAGVILVVCYMIFAAKSGTSGNGLLITGGLVAAVVMALFVSAIYQTSFLRGGLIVISHLILAAVLGYIAIFGTDLLLPADDVGAFWETWIFVPTGLVDGQLPQGY